MNGLDRLKLFSAIRDADLSKNDRLVLYTIATRLNVEGIAWPGVESIARDSGLSERACRHAIADLEARGVLLVTRGGGARNTNVYALAEAKLVPRENLRSMRAERKRVHPVQGSEKGAPDAGFPYGGPREGEPGTPCTPTLHAVQGYPGIACTDNPAPPAPEQIQANGIREQKKERSQGATPESSHREGGFGGITEAEAERDGMAATKLARTLRSKSTPAEVRARILTVPYNVDLLLAHGFGDLVDRFARPSSAPVEQSSPRLVAGARR